MTNPGYMWMPRDWLSSTFVQSLKRHDRDIYRELLDRAWLDDGLPNDLVSLARVLGEPPRAFTKLWETLRSHFVLGDDGRWRNPKQEDEREYQRTKARAGRLGGLASQANVKQTPSKPPSKTKAGSGPVLDVRSKAKVEPPPAPAPAPTLAPSEPRERAPRAAASPPPLPASLDRADIREALETYQASRREQGHKPLGPKGLGQLYAKLESVSPSDAVEALRHAAASGHQGVFPKASGRTGSGNGVVPFADQGIENCRKVAEMFANQSGTPASTIRLLESTQ